MGEWEPSSPFERHLQAAHAMGDLALCLGLLRAAEFALPLSAAAAAGEEPAAWPTADGGERVWLVAYTSAQAMRAATGGLTDHHRVVSLPELAAGWPDPGWGLAVNPGLPVGFFLEPGTVARLAAPSPAHDRAAEPGSGAPIMQKPLRPADLYAYLAEGGSRVSGYCHQAMDVAHIATPAVLADALGQASEEGVLTEQGSVNLLRWRAAGLSLYRVPYGGTDELTRAAVAGWVIEEPPFTGMGFAPNVDQVIREYKIDGLALPHGAEIWELTVSGVEFRRAVFDGDLARWLLVHESRPDETSPGEAPSGAGATSPETSPGEGPSGAAAASDGALAEEPSPGGPRRAAARWQRHRARVGGAEYEAVPDARPDGLWMRLRGAEPAEGFERVGPGLFVRPVRAGDCEAIEFVTTVGEWRGVTCKVHDERGDELLVEYAGGLLPVARELGLRRAERGVHRDWVPRREVLGLRELAVPLDD
ncbi:SseB family protein [Sphaerisporangium sp. TRM90804]|uniref:SseB family protein n=1 Tax=Sphaerisporangium sp. TRM90804 TaxID=3031113 RepID=UPI00244AEABB|nr:SseB family protein [Sphaerisporangium sp. TRM90804]MDH2425066.1 SseB family protein [Sphaerisporangium sp. TRM90804]